MKILLLYLSILSIGSSYFYACDKSKSTRLSVKQQELDAVRQEQVNRAAHADTVVTTLQKEPIQLKRAAYRRPFRIIGIELAQSGQNSVDIATAFIQNDHDGTCSMRQGKIVYNQATDSFSDISQVVSLCANTLGTCLCCNHLPVSYALRTLFNPDTRRSLPHVVILSNSTAVTAVSHNEIKLMCVDFTTGHIVAAYTRRLSNNACIPKINI